MSIKDLTMITPPEAEVVWVEAPAAAAPEAPTLCARHVAEKCRISLRTLRLLEAHGLVVPVRAGRTRSYGPREQQRLDRILRWYRLGFTLAEIGQVVAVEGGRESAAALYAVRRKCLERSHQIEDQMRDIMDDLAELRRIQRALCSAPFGAVR
jgi:DNA-binding transcriptional MerR regulator